MIGVLNFPTGTQVSVIRGTHKGKLGTVSEEKPSRKSHQGKTPVRIGGAGRCKTCWIETDYLALQEKPKQLVENSEYDSEDTTSLPPEQIKILEYLSVQDKPVSSIAIATELDWSLLITEKQLKDLISNEYVEQVGDYDYQVTEKWTLQQSDCSRELAGFSSPQVESGDSNGLNQSKSTPTPSKSLEHTTTTPSTQTSEHTTQNQEQPIALLVGSPVETHRPQETAPEFTEENQACGGKCTELSTKSDPSLSSSKTQKVCDIEDLTKLSTPLPLAGTWGNGSVYQQPTLERPTNEIDYLSLPTLTSSLGTENSRPAGTTKCEEWFKNNGIIAPSHALSAQMMALLSGFPKDWTACLSASPQEQKEELEVDTSTAEQLYQPALQSPLPESSISGPYSIGRQWVTPQDITLTAGTQSRDLLYGAVADSETMDRYAEMMRDDLWEWAREPLPVAFIDVDGKIYAGDCHNRVSAARAANRQILMELRPGTLQDAKLYSCQANTDHGLPLRPKDNRKRIEMFLNLLGELNEERSLSLLQEVPGLTDTERSNGRWSARIIAKYLKLTESGYRTVTNIQSEREMAVKISQFNVGDYVLHKSTIAQVYNCDPKKGLLIVTVDPNNDQLIKSYANPDDVEKSDPPVTIKPQPKEAKSVKEELKNKAKELGLPTKEQTLPDVQRNDGPPETLIDDRPFATDTGMVESHTDDICIAIISNVDRLSDAQIKAVWEAIKPRLRGMTNAE